MKQETTEIHIGYAPCPSCGEVCTAHRFATGHIGYEDWQKSTLDYWCAKCKTSFQEQGDIYRWLSKRFRDFKSSDMPKTNAQLVITGKTGPGIPVLAQCSICRGRT